MHYTKKQYPNKYTNWMYAEGGGGNGGGGGGGGMYASLQRSGK